MKEGAQIQRIPSGGLRITALEIRNLWGVSEAVIKPGQRRLLLDTRKRRGSARVLASASRITQQKSERGALSYISGGPIDTTCATRIHLPRAPQSVAVVGADGRACEFSDLWDEASKTLLLTHANAPETVAVRVRY